MHDRGDRRVPFTQSERLAEVNAPAARLVATDGLGHNRILRADVTLDEVTAFLTAADVATRRSDVGQAPRLERTTAS